MVNCPACGVANSETREYCQECMGELPAARPGTGASNGTSAATAGGMNSDVAMPSTTPALAESAPQVLPSAACPRHPDMPAAGTCVRCGTFFCENCVPNVLAKNIECPSCLESKEAREAPATVKEHLKQQWITLVVLGLLVGGMGFAAVYAGPEQHRFNNNTLLLFNFAVFNGLILTVPFALAALMVGLVRRMWAVWVGYVIETLMFVLIAISSFGFNLVTLISLCAPIWSLVRVLTLDELMKKYPSARAS